MAKTQENQDGYFTKAEYESDEGIINISDRGFFYSLSPAERIEVAKKVKEQVENGQDFQNLKDENTRYMLMKAYTQLEIVNKATSKAYNEYRTQLDQDISKMANGEIKNINLEYKDRNGNQVKDIVGVGKDRDGNVYYYEEKYRRDGMPIVKNIDEDDFGSRVSACIRNNIKDEQGIGQNLYEMTDDEGNKLVITDARDDTSKQNSFRDGLRDVNVYRVSADGNKEQMTQKDLTAVIQASGINKESINRKKAPTIIEDIKTAYKATKELHQFLDKNVVQNSEIMTSTH